MIFSWSSSRSSCTDYKVFTLDCTPISLHAVKLIPSPSLVARNFLIAHFVLAVDLASALYTIPYVPSPTSKRRSYLIVMSSQNPCRKGSGQAGGDKGGS